MRETLATEDYRALYRAIGEPVQWDERLLMSRAALAALLAGLHTDTNDHPKARQTYQCAGFQIYLERWESFQS